MNTTQLPAPVANADSRPYWDAVKDQKLLIRKCSDCGELHFMPRYLCPFCWSDKLEWVQSKGAGSVHSYTVIRRAPVQTFATRVPYVIALIELDEGPRMMANVLGEDALDTKIGDRVNVIFEDRGEDAKVPQFKRVKA